MTIYNLGRYGIIDDISIDDLLAQKDECHHLRCYAVPEYQKNGKVTLVRDQINLDKGMMAFDLKGKRVVLPTKDIKKLRHHTPLGVILRQYATELVAVFSVEGRLKQQLGIEGFTLRKYWCKYLGMDNVTEADWKRVYGAQIQGTNFQNSLDNPDCLSLDLFAIIGGKELKDIAGEAVCIPHLGVGRDVTERFIIEIFSSYRNCGLGSMMETQRTKLLKNIGQKLMVLTGVNTTAVRYWSSKGFGFYQSTDREWYNGYGRLLEGHIMAKVIDASIITAQNEGHIDWSSNPTQPLRTDRRTQFNAMMNSELSEFLKEWDGEAEKLTNKKITSD